MIKLRHYRLSLFLLALTVVCTAEEMCAQEDVPAPSAFPFIVDRKQAVKMVLAQSIPDYPPVAKVNYLQGQVQLQLTVDGKGKVASAHVLDGIAILAESALEAAHRWIYRPLATPSGTSGFVTTVKLKFALSSRGIELTPQQAERDFLSHVKPSRVVRSAETAHPGDVVHMRLLVNDQGDVVDMDTSPTDRAQFDAARETLRGWTFRPAQWGNLPIASYLDVDVPVSAPSITRAAANSVSP